MGIITKITDWVTTPYTIYLVLKDPAVSRSVKVRAVIGLAVIFVYVVSPIDIVPDFIPVAGWMDDIVVVPIGLLIIRLITPGINLVEKRGRAQAGVKKIIFWTIFSVLATILLGLSWVGLMIYIIIKLFTH
jgi:uncharacterized membrane protein YkvA (DUF1232 family)